MSLQVAAPLSATDAGPVAGRTLEIEGRPFYQITAYDQIPPFFMTLVGASDLWVFISSSGGLTAGRVEAEHALFPYYTEDKVAEGAGRTGGDLGALSFLGRRQAAPGRKAAHAADALAHLPARL